MGWSSGSQLAEEVWRLVAPKLVHPVQEREEVANALIELFENHDADDWDTSSALWKASGRETEW